MAILLYAEIALGLLAIRLIERGCGGCKSCSKGVFSLTTERNFTHLIWRILHPLIILTKLFVLCIFPIPPEDDHPPAYSPLHSRDRKNPLDFIDVKSLKIKMDNSFVLPNPVQQSSLGETRQAVTNAKLDELSRTNKKLNAYYTPVVESAQSSTNEWERLNSLHKAMVDAEAKNIQVTDADGDRIDLDIIKDILDEASVDPCVGDNVLKPHSENLLAAIKQAQRKHQYASLYANVFKEWLSSDSMDEDGIATPTSDTTEAVDLGGRPEKVVSRQELEAVIFAPSTDSDPVGTVEYITSLFNSAKQSAEEGETDDEDLSYQDQVDRKPLEMLQDAITGFGNRTSKHTIITETDVKQSIHGLISSELLTEGKRSVCKEILLDEKIISEIARVLTIQLRDIDSWSWPESGVPMVFRRHLNGKYRCYSDEGIMDAIFLQYIGVVWGIEIRARLKTLYDSKVWIRKENPVDLRLSEIRRHMVPNEYIVKDSSKRDKEKQFEDEFFQSLLPVSLYDFRSYREDGDEQPEENPFPDRRARQEELKQKLLQRMLVDARYSKAVSPDEPFTIAHADIEKFAPSLCHDTILEVMRMTGVPEQWIKFFRTFLELPARFEERGEVKVSKRGVPISHPLGLIFGEVLLFYLEFAVNRKTGAGLELFRLHDDFWFWSASDEKMVTAWETMKHFLSLCGNKWNMSKSGSVKVTHNTPLPNDQIPDVLTPGAEPLPQGKLSWAFVNLHSDGMFRIDKEQITKHTEEMKRQLSSQRSVLGFVGAYNRYMHFFNRNFAEPARVFGKGHVEEVIKVFRKIHEDLFPEFNGDVLQSIKTTISKKFPSDIPTDESLLEAWIVLPLSLGGLGLRNTTLDIYPLLSQFLEEEKPNAFNAVATFASCINQDKRLYNAAKKIWEGKLVYPSMSHLLPPSRYIEEKDSKQKRKPMFMPFEEYILGRETKLLHWGQAWDELVTVPQGKSRRTPERVARALRNTACREEALAPLKKNWLGLSRYWQGVMTVYGAQALDAFGRLDYIDQSLLPVAMIEVFNNAKVKWDQ